MKKSLIMAIVLSFTASAAVQAAQYTIDNTHAHIGFNVSHLVISKVKGEFNDYEATLTLDENNNLTGAEATIQVGSIDTGIKKRDAHLLNDDFFSAETFETITFKSKEVKDGIIVADFTIRDVTKEVELPYEILGPITDPWGNTKLGFSASLTIDRTEYGVAWNEMTETGAAIVGKDVEIVVDAEFTKVPDADDMM